MIISTPFPALVNALSLFFFLRNFSPFLAVLISTSIVAPLVEEFAKAYPLFYRHGETEKSIITLGFLTGLGFGIAEYFLYVYAFNAPADIRLPLLLFHASNTAIVAYGIAIKRPLLFYLIAVFLHFLNNIFAQFGFSYIGGPLVVLVSYLLAWIIYKQSKEKPIDY